VPAVVTTISPGRGRPADLVTINGSGFNVLVARNRVTFAGVLAGINWAGANALQVVVPVGLPVDQHVEVEVENLDDPGAATWYWWSQDTVVNTDASILRVKVPWRDEKLRGLGRDVKDMSTAEARFFERIATKIELVRDLVAAKGDFFSRSGAALGLRQALAGTAGQPFVSGVDAVGGQFQDRQCQTMQWGLFLEDTDLTKFMEAYAHAGNSNEIVVGVPALDAGQVALVSVRERVSATSRIVEIEVYVNGSSVLLLQNGDPDFPGPGIRNGQSLTFYPGIRVAQGDRVSLRVARNSITTDCSVLAYALVA
jgi:hypothetical protein